MTPLPEGFTEGLDTVFEFVEDNKLRIRPGRIQTHDDDTKGAVYEVAQIDQTVTLNAKHLKMMNGLIKHIDFGGDGGISYFYGDNLRGAMSHFRS